MKRTFLLLVTLIAWVTGINAQVNKPVSGVYSLEGVRETASGFKLNADSTFEFYYSYGSLDRYGSGKWSINRDGIVLNSKIFRGKDFEITDSSALESENTTIQMADANPAFYRFIYCLFKTPNGDTLLNANTNGIIILPGKADTIDLLFELSPERISRFVINRKYNACTFKFEPWALEVLFSGFVLKWVQDHLEGKHPLLGDKKYIYRKD